MGVLPLETSCGFGKYQVLIHASGSDMNLEVKTLSPEIG